MGDGLKHPPGGSVASDIRGILSVVRTRKTKVFAYGFVSAFVACTVFIAFSPSGSASPWFNNLFTSASATTAPVRSQFSSFFSSIFPNSSSSSPSPPPSSARGWGFTVKPLNENKNNTSPASAPPGEMKGLPTPKNQKGKGVASQQDGVSGRKQKNGGVGSHQNGVLPNKNQTKEGGGPQQSGVLGKNQTSGGVGSPQNGVLAKNQTEGGSGSQQNGASGKNQTTSGGVGSQRVGASGKNQTSGGIPADGKSGFQANSQGKGSVGSVKDGSLPKNQTKGGAATPAVPAAGAKNTTASAGNGHKGFVDGSRVSNISTSLRKRNGPAGSATTVGAPSGGGSGGGKSEKWSIQAMKSCDIFHGRWVEDNSYPLYKEGSCTHIDESFNCFLNGRLDRAYQKLRWQPSGCNIPRLNPTDMLERLRGKRLVFVGDSLNRNMWESLVCVLRNSIKDKSKVFEASGSHEFRTEGSYSFLFKDYNCSVEFFRSPFLVQEWEMPETDGKKKETLRLDIIERSSSGYKDADIIIFNTGHWWTHEKTSKGKDYYQEGNRVYGQLKVIEAFHKALNTWAKWVDANVNPHKSLVFFRGYSATHFRGGQWNSGGQCDRETEPIKNEKYLSSYPPKMSVLESVIGGMKTPVSYLNITRMTDYRKDAHPSIYRKQNLTEEDRRSPERYQDCSHWCLPGVPDSWNELLYAQLLIKQHQIQ